MAKLKINRMVLGMVYTNTWLAENTETKEVLLIDPADTPERIEAELEKRKLQPVAILLTHGHFDHIGAAEALREKYQIPCYAGEQEVEILATPSMNLSGSYGKEIRLTPDHSMKDGEKVTLAGFKIEVIATPGHTKGGVCYYLPEEKTLFSGDSLFRASIGRTDLPTGSTSQLVRSVRALLEKLPGDTQVYPGHEEPTSISFEKRYNSFI